MQRLQGRVRDYAWGSKTAIPQLFGLPAAEVPVAELWLGAHPGAPTRIGDTSMVFTAEIVDQLDDAVLARSRTILVAADADGKPIKLPQELREPLEAMRV